MVGSDRSIFTGVRRSFYSGVHIFEVNDNIEYSYALYCDTISLFATLDPDMKQAEISPSQNKNISFIIEFDENSIFSRYDVIMLIDGNAIKTLSHGKSYSFVVPISEGKHTLTFCQKGSREIKGSAELNVKEPRAIGYNIHCYSEKVSIDELFYYSFIDLFPVACCYTVLSTRGNSYSYYLFSESTHKVISVGPGEGREGYQVLTWSGSLDDVVYVQEKDYSYKLKRKGNSLLYYFGETETDEYADKYVISPSYAKSALQHLSNKSFYEKYSRQDFMSSN